MMFYSDNDNIITTIIPSARYAAYSPESQRGIASFEYTDVNYPSTTVMLENLEKGQLYEIRLGSMNSEGVSEPSNPTVIYVGVAGKIFTYFFFAMFTPITRYRN